ncbi:hypothetical protein RHSIM_Rhsim13G0088000 [Rhododendron simsii]|uniref:Exocyst subunit Exo70 family protein n=1 Tax=Rhododendron simsii TaxID=118357 RepID=A0A834G1F0_RHOSS|nr:hypothetical protein RHSIM_RhsimUnG0009200 [Rhododendron simsii]KAF7119761.1 hypothetical protein RHSIM_Rhsim13G0088000 [Rhododendron simsii]
MPSEGMSTVFMSPSRASSPSSSPLRNSSPPAPRQTFSSSMMAENLDIAESLITKWSVEERSSNFCKITSLFTDRRDVKDYLRSVKDLQAAMHFFVSDGSSSSSHQLVRAQNLMQNAMKRLEREFYQILSSNRSNLDPESVSSRSSRTSASISDFEDDCSEEDNIHVAGGDSVHEVTSDSALEVAMADLKTIADSMISSGYSKECVKIYKLVRKSMLDESLYYLGVEKLSLSQIQKLDWDVVDVKIKSWLNAVKVAVKTLFLGERILCDVVFSASPKISESCFAEITRENAVTLFGFPEHVAKYKKLTPEKLFRVLDLYDSISELWPETESIFSSDLVSAVRSQAVNSLVRLGEPVRAMLSEFEAAIQKDGSKTPVQGGGVHPLTRYVMNYVVFLSDYSGSLSDVLADSALNTQSPLPESYFSSPTPYDCCTSALSVRLAWLILVLLCKLDGKAEEYKDVALAYLFLANNLNYVVSKVRLSGLKLLLGDEWIESHEAKVKQYAANYERMGWSKVMSSLPEADPAAEIPIQEARECFRSFNSGFEEAYRKQTSWVVPDPKLRDEIKVSLAKKLMPAYTSFYEEYRWLFGREAGVEPVVRYAPDDLGNYLSDLFYGTEAAGSVSSSVCSSPSPRQSRGRKVR